MPWLTILQALGANLWTFLSSRFGQICIAFVVAWMWSGAKTNARWEAVIAAQRAAAEIAYQKEIARQAQVTQEIAAAATARAEEDAELEKALRAQIQDLENAEPKYETRTLTREKVVHGPCAVDDDLVGRMRKLDATAHQTRVARPTRKVR